MKRLRSNVHSNKARLEEVLEALPEGYVITITDRVPSGRPLDYDYLTVLEQRAEYLRSERDPHRKGIDYLMYLLFRFQYPQFSIRWRFDKDHVVERGTKFVEEVVETIKELHSFVEFANQGI